MISRGRFVDISERAIVCLTGSESLDLLQRISTSDIVKIGRDKAIQTVLANEKGRIVEVVSVLDIGAERLFLFGQGTDAFLIRDWIGKYIIMENISVSVLTNDFVHVMIYDSNENMEGDLRRLMSSGSVFFDESLASATMTHIIAVKTFRDAMIKALTYAGFVQSGKDDYEEYRVSRGIPGFPSELSASFNPLEAGLFSLVSFTKGCYIGQEVIARLDTYNKVQRRLVRLKLAELPVGLPQTIYAEGQEWGILTSAIKPRGTLECRGLGYLRTGYEHTAEGLHFRNGKEPVKLMIES